MLTAAVLVLKLFAVSALEQSSTFRFVNYPRVFRRNDVACQMCYGEFDCVRLDKGRCSYNAAVAEVLNKQRTSTTNIALATKVDSMMYDLLLDDTVIKEYNQCVPLISSYNNCNKGNICSGCQICECDEAGRWRCSESRRCSPMVLTIDHHLLTTIVDSLKKRANSTRLKRSNDASRELRTRSEELPEWEYVTNLMQVQDVNVTLQNSAVSSTTASIKTTEENNSNLAFDEIITNDDLAHFINSSETNIGDTRDNIDSQQFLEFLKNIEQGIEESEALDNPRNINLFNELKKYLKEGNFNSKVSESSNSSKDQPNSINSIITDNDDFDVNKQPSDINAVAYALKREVRQANITATNKETPTRTIETKKRTQSDEELQHLVDIVTVLIGNQHKEIIHLHYVKDNLLRIINRNKMHSSIVMQNPHEVLDNNSSDHDWKINVLKFYTSNLNSDIKDVLRDINAVQNLKKKGVIPALKMFSNLKPLLLVLTEYYFKMNGVNRTAFRMNAKNYSPRPNNLFSLTYNRLTSPIINKAVTVNGSVHKANSAEPKPQRRTFISSLINEFVIELINRALRRMLTVINNDRLSSTQNLLSALTPTTYNIFIRIVDKYYVNNNTTIVMRDPHFNLTNLLTNLAQSWKNTEVDILKFHPADKLYHLKMVHFTLSQGIDKVKDALNSIKFGYSRRMNFIEEQAGKDVVADASKFLSNIDGQINYYILEAKKTKKVDSKIIQDTESAWQNIKKAFTNSKNGLTKYFRNLLKPKSYVVNEMTKKRMQEINKAKFLEVMKKWQETFEMSHSRKKRTPRRNSMKNIIPKYLRGKVKALNTQLEAKKLAAKVGNKG